MSADSFAPTDETVSQNPEILSSHNIPEQVDEIRERIDTLVDQEMWGQLHSLLATLPAADVASLIAHYQEPILSSIFQGLPDDLKPDVLAELPSDAATELATALPPPATADIANDMAPDDAADVLGELDKEISSKIIEGMDEDSAEEVRKLMTYPETSAGGIMTTDLLRFSKEQTVLEALDAIADNPDEEHIYQVYITDDDGVLTGTVSIWELLHQRDRLVKLGAIMEQQVMAVRSDTDQEEVAELMAKYNLSVIAVVDDNGVLLGRITHDDAADILKEEAEE
ncbi:MAG: magnesium transporter, partial [Kiritimatiellia bacterium]